MGEMTNQEDLSALKDVNVETESAHPGPSVQHGRLPSPGHRPSTALGTRRSSARAGTGGGSQDWKLEDSGAVTSRFGGIISFDLTSK